jgi:hypothetical protein
MASLSFHQRLNDMRDRALRDPSYRPVYAHALSVAHLQGRLIASDHPSWARMEAALIAARGGDPGALDTIQRELARLVEIKNSQ